MKSGNRSGPGTALASGMLAGFGAAAAGIALGYALPSGNWQSAAPQLCALVAAPVAAWFTAFRRGRSLPRATASAFLALLIGFFVHAVLAYVLLLNLVVSPVIGGDTAEAVQGAVHALLWRFSLVVSLLNALLGAVVGLMVGASAPQSPSAWRR